MGEQIFFLPEKIEFPAYIDGSMASAYTCHRKYAWRYIHDLAPKATPTPLSGGGVIHDGLEGYYTAQAAGAVGWQNLAKAAMEAAAASIQKLSPETKALLVEDDKRNPERILKALWLYAENYQKDTLRAHPDRIEKGFALPVPNSDIAWVGRMDLVGDYGMDSKIVGTEHKHTTRMSAAYWNQWHPSWQIDGYYWAGTEFMQDFWAMIINVIVLHKESKKEKEGKAHEPSILFDRMIMQRRPHQTRLFLLDIQDLIADMRAAYKKRERGFWMNRSYCMAYYRECEFRQLCTIEDRKMLERRIETEYVQSKWAPYEELVVGKTKEGVYQED